MFSHRFGGLFEPGDRVKFVEGSSFEGFEGILEAVDTESGIATIILTIFGRSTPIEVKTWQLERI